VNALQTTAMVVTIVVAIFNVAWTVWSQRRDRDRWVASGHIVSLNVIHSLEAGGAQWAQLEVRNIGRGQCTVDEVGSWYSPSGPAYGYYTSEEDSGYELARDSAELPYVLEGGRKANWLLDMSVLRSTARDSEHGATLHLYVDLQNGERHTVPFPVDPTA
jgi:hypothetical protein